MFRQLLIKLVCSGIVSEFVDLIKFECGRTCKSPIEVLDAGLKGGSKDIKMLLLIAMERGGFSLRETKETVDEIFRRFENRVHAGDGCACGRTCGCARSLSGLSEEERSLILDTD